MFMFKIFIWENNTKYVNVMNLIKQEMLETDEVYHALSLSVIFIYDNCYSVICIWLHTFDIKS